MNPYRVQPEPRNEPPPEPMPSEEKFLVILLVVIGGIRVLIAVIAGQRFDAEPTIGLMMVLAGILTGLRIDRWRRWRRRSGESHERSDDDRADRDGS